MPNVSLTDELEEYVQGKLESGLYNSVSEVVREALREKIEREREDAVERHLTKLIVEGVDLGVPDGVPEEVWTARRDAALKRVRQYFAQRMDEVRSGDVVDGPAAMEKLRHGLENDSDGAE